MSAAGSTALQSPISAKRSERMERLRGALGDPDPGVRLSVARSLERLESRSDVEHLIARLRDEDKLTRLNAVYGLGALADPAGLPALVEALRDPVEDIRAAAVRVLGELRVESTLDPLVERLDDASPLVRRHAIEALGRFGDLRVAPVLRSLLGESELEIVREALRALGACRDPEAEGEIVYHLDHRDAGVRAAAAEALGRSTEHAPRTVGEASCSNGRGSGREPYLSRRALRSVVCPAPTLRSSRLSSKPGPLSGATPRML